MRRLNNGFYQSSAWERCRTAYMKHAGGLCERCKRNGIIKAGRVVHHIVPLTEKNYTIPYIAYGFGNLMLVCQACHEEIHEQSKRQMRQEEKFQKNERYRFGKNGEISPP